MTQATNKLLQMKKRIRAVCGGTSASKTISILMILIDYAGSNDKKKIDVMSESYPHLEDGAIKDFKDIMADRGYWTDSRWNESKHVYTFETGSRIKFISIDKLGKARGPRRDVLYVNEADNIPYNIYEQLEVRTKEIIWLDWNPAVEFWYYSQIKDNVDHDFLTLTYLDCLDALDPRIVESIESKKGNERWWKVYGLGQLGSLEGKIYKDWKIIDKVPHEARLDRRGLDFGFSVDPTVIINIYRYNGGFILDELTYQKGLSNKSIADILKNDDPRKLTVADSAEPKSIEEIRSHGVSITGAVKGAGSVNAGIDFVQEQPISMTARSVKTIKAYRNYIWKKDKFTEENLNVPDDRIHEWSNPMDAIRYGFSSLKVDKKEKKQFRPKTNYHRN